MSGGARLVRTIAAGGALADPAWRAAFEEVPRELFVPYYFAAAPDGGGHERRSQDDPDPRARARWRQGVYEDVPLATRIRNGELVSSSSQPSLMARMLESLRVGDGMAVLEIGTGPGYNAALLSHRLGDRNVTTIDLDRDITDAARAHLAAAGYRPAVITGDGARGCPARAPFDRVIATCALPTVPPAWVRQCAADGLILAPLATGLVLLRATGPAHASGRFLDTPAYFVPLRGGPPPPEPPVPTGVPPHAGRHDSYRFLLGLAGRRIGPRAAYEIWEAEGRPDRERYGVTLHGSRQWAWLDRSDGPFAWPLGEWA